MVPKLAIIESECQCGGILDVDGLTANDAGEPGDLLHAQSG